MKGDQVVGVVRNGSLLNDYEQHALVCKDQVIILASNTERIEIGKFFGPVILSNNLGYDDFFGEFDLNPEAKLIDLANAYGVDASSFDKDLSLEQYILNQFHGKPVVGDQVKLDFICLIVKGVENKKIISIGLKLKSSS
ncbi:MULTISPECIES: transporter associated domain-containing protein [unclassified Pseudoalteromonas]|nr:MULTISPECIES: transporter associated domain-containing protein [unclassified Pseudoalteromonas]MCF2849992.1 hypothetical protein [Pseudoalteromonas sp. PAST1]